MTSQPQVPLLEATVEQWEKLPRVFSPAILRRILVFGYAAPIVAKLWGNVGQWSDGQVVSWGLNPAELLLLIILIPVLVAPRVGLWAALGALQSSWLLVPDFEPDWSYFMGTAIVGIAAVTDLFMGLRQRLAIGSLARKLRDSSSTTVPLGQEHASNIRRDAREGWWLIPGFLAVLGLLTASDMSPALSFGVVLWLCVLIIRTLWRVFSTRILVHTLWVLPPSNDGPITTLGFAWLTSQGLPQEEQTRAGCSCEAHEEFVENSPVGSSFDEEFYGGIAVDVHCPIHGIDAVNAMTATEFAAVALNQAWIWNRSSTLPLHAVENATAVLGFAGTGLLGRVGILGDEGFTQVPGSPVQPLENYALAKLEETLWKRSSDRIPAANPAPRIGMLDELDLRGLGITGRIRRYKHAHPMFVPTDETNHWWPRAEKRSPWHA